MPSTIEVLHVVSNGDSQPLVAGIQGQVRVAGSGDLNADVNASMQVRNIAPCKILRQEI